MCTLWYSKLEKIKVINVSIFSVSNLRNTKGSVVLCDFVRIVFLYVCFTLKYIQPNFDNLSTQFTNEMLLSVGHICMLSEHNFKQLKHYFLAACVLHIKQHPLVLHICYYSRALGMRLQFLFLPVVDRCASSVFKILM